MNNSPLPVNQLTIGGIVYAISYHEKIGKGKRKLYGDITYENAEIRIATYAQQVQRQTLLHEAIHGVLAHAGIYNHDENLIDIIANGLHQVLINNPEFVRLFEQTNLTREFVKQYGIVNNPFNG